MVDFIFMVGHWNRDIGCAYIGDWQQGPHGPPAPAQEAGEEQGGDTVPSRVAALRARAQHRYLINRLRRYRATNGPAGPCEACGWHTEWEPEEENQPRISCFYCRRRVCRQGCTVRDYLVCKPCHAEQGKEPDEVPGFDVPPAKVRRVDSADRCYTCTRPGVSVLGGLASSQAASPGAPASSQAAAALPPEALLRCHRCDRWLCRTCRQEQAPPSCVVCPVLHPPDGVSLRQVQNPVSEKTLERLCRLADQCTLARGRGRLASTGEYTHQHDIHGRAERVARGMGKRARMLGSG